MFIVRRVKSDCFFYSQGRRGIILGLDHMHGLAKLYMIDWGRKFRSLLSEVTENTKVPGIDLNAPFIKIFVDDENSFHKVTPPGAVYDKKEKKIVISQDQLQNDEEKSEDRGTADVITTIASISSLRSLWQVQC